VGDHSRIAPEVGGSVKLAVNGHAWAGFHGRRS